MQSERRPPQDGEYGRAHLGEEKIDLFEYVYFCIKTSGMVHKKLLGEEIAVRVRRSLVERTMDVFCSLHTHVTKSLKKTICIFLF